MVDPLTASRFGPRFVPNRSGRIGTGAGSVDVAPSGGALRVETTRAPIQAAADGASLPPRSAPVPGRCGMIPCPALTQFNPPLRAGASSGFRRQPTRSLCLHVAAAGDGRAPAPSGRRFGKFVLVRVNSRQSFWAFSHQSPSKSEQVRPLKIMNLNRNGKIARLPDHLGEEGGLGGKAES